MSKPPPVPQTQRAGHEPSDAETASRRTHTPQGGPGEPSGAGHEANLRQNTAPARNVQDR